MSRIAARFAQLKAQNRSALITFITAGDPDPVTSQTLLNSLPKAGADMIELGMPFSDPMADGPAIQAASLRALKSGANMNRTLAMVKDFRKQDTTTPIILMGYFNPIYARGPNLFCRQAADAGVDGLIVVDLPPEEAEELTVPAAACGVDFIFLTAPTTDQSRLPVVLAKASGFVYYISISGVTGTSAARPESVANAVNQLRMQTDLPLAVGFGIRTARQVSEIAEIADAVVVGSAIVKKLADHVGANPVPDVLDFVKELAAGTERPNRI